MSHDGLRELEHLVLLAIARLEPPAHGVPIVKELKATVGRSISRASVYVVLRRLEAKGLVSSTLGDPTPERGGRAKRLYTLTPAAVRQLKTAQRDFVRLWAGSRVLGVLLCLCLAGFTTVSAQTRPNLTGTWLNLSDPNATDVKVGSTLPNAVLTITHEGDRFHLVRSWSRAPITETHICDGRENTNRYSVVVERTKCRWEPADGGTLVIEGTIGQESGAMSGTLTQRYHLDKDGVLIVHRVRTLTWPTGEPRGPNYTERYRKVPPSVSEAGQ
jgi:PadR family transcriptional regulator PadR